MHCTSTSTDGCSLGALNEWTVDKMLCYVQSKPRYFSRYISEATTYYLGNPSTQAMRKQRQVHVSLNIQSHLVKMSTPRRNHEGRPFAAATRHRHLIAVVTAAAAAIRTADHQSSGPWSGTGAPRLHSDWLSGHRSAQEKSEMPVAAAPYVTVILR